MTMRTAVQYRVFDTLEALSRDAAERLVELARRGNGRFAVCLSGGSTPKRLYEDLAAAPLAAQCPWDHLHWFWGDERFVPHDHPDSNFRLASEAFLSRVPIPDGHIHAIPTVPLSPAEAAERYEAALRDFHGADASGKRWLFDVTLLGLGEDGHIASLFPSSAALDETQRWVVPVARAGSAARITLTYPALAMSRIVVFLVAGARKRDALARVWAGDSALPATRLRAAGEVWWLVDRAAAPSLPPNLERT
jgi:6-phosphogluconolactonase